MRATQGARTSSIPPYSPRCLQICATASSRDLTYPFRSGRYASKHDRFRMADDIPYNKVFTLEPGQAEEVAPGVRRVIANNPSPFTFKGTVSYIVGRDNVAIIDPGPD